MSLIVFQDEYFIISQCHTCDVPGYLVLECKAQASNLGELPTDAQTRLGLLLGQLELCLIKVLDPEQVYFGKFSESGGNLHFHVFPRLASITSKYLEHYPSQRELIHGPMLLDWAREHYKVEAGGLSAEVISTLCEIKRHLESRFTCASHCNDPIAERIGWRS